MKINKQGYVEIEVDGKKVLAHRYVVEKFIGRKLKPKEVVHHLDFDRSNNHPSNLMIFKNQNAHALWHNKVKKFSYLTNPMKRQVLNRWKEYGN